MTRHERIQTTERMSLSRALLVADNPLDHDTATIRAAEDALNHEIHVREKHDETVPFHIDAAHRSLIDLCRPYPGVRTFANYGGAK